METPKRLSTVSADIGQFRDGGLVMHLTVDGEYISGGEQDLVFATGAMVDEDPLLHRQRKLMEFVAEALRHYNFSDK